MTLAMTDIQQLLDGLDRQLALGQIDLGTYQTLRAKFSAQVMTPPKLLQDPLRTIQSQMGQQAQAIKCPGCMAPAAASFANRDGVITCEFCGGAFSLRTATDEMERLRADIRKWVADLAGGFGGGIGNGIIDEASRKFIFTDKLLPSLRLAADRATETFGAFRHGPLFSFPITNELPRSPFMEAHRSMPDSMTIVERVKTTEARAGSAEIMAFAVGDADRIALQVVQAACQESVRLASARRHALSFDADGLSKSVANLSALKDLYEQTQRASSNDPARARFARALARRMTALIDATNALQSLLKVRDGVFPGPFAVAFDNAASVCDVSAADLEVSGVDPRESIPAAEGARVDAQTMRIVRDCVRLYGSCGAERGFPFEDVVRSLANLVARAHEPQSDLEWLASFLVQLSTHVNAAQGEPLVALVTDHAAAEAEAHADAKSGFIVGAEAVSIGGRMLIPFWVAELTFTQQTGMIFKKGKAAQELVFLDAASHSGRWFRATTDSDVGRITSHALTQFGALPRSTDPLLPVVALDAAVARFKQIIQTTPGYAGGRPKMHGLVYLPAVRASFANRQGRRDATFVAGAGAQFSSITSNPVRFGTFDLKLA
jgi:hypothetical protein